MQAVCRLAKDVYKLRLYQIYFGLMSIAVQMTESLPFKQKSMRMTMILSCDTYQNIHMAPLGIQYCMIKFNVLVLIMIQFSIGIAGSCMSVNFDVDFWDLAKANLRNCLAVENCALDSSKMRTEESHTLMYVRAISSRSLTILFGCPSMGTFVRPAFDDSQKAEILRRLNWPALLCCQLVKRVDTLYSHELESLQVDHLLIWKFWIYFCSYECQSRK